MALSDAGGLRGNSDAREPETSSEGYHISWETRAGVIGLWSCWLRDQLYLGWPNAFGPIPSEQVLKAFPEAKLGSRERQGWTRRIGTYTIQLPRSGEVTTLDVGHHQNAQHFPVLRGETLGKSGPPHVSYGWGEADQHSWGSDLLSRDSGYRLFTEPFWHPEGEGDDKTVRNEWYDSQESRFIALGCDLANEHGIEGVTVQLGINISIVPESLPAMGFQTKWLRGTPGVRQGWHSEAVYGSRVLADGRVEEVMLVSANSLVPWVCYRRQPVPEGGVTPEFVREMLTF